MSNSQFALEKFIYSIPTCRPTENLSTLIDLLNSSPVDAIAVLNDENFPIGIIDSQCLIGLSDQNCSRSLPVAGHSLQVLIQKLFKQTSPTATKSKNRQSLSTILDLHSVIKPIVILRAKINQDEFLSQLQLETNYFNNQVSYLVVDGERKLLGWLALQKLMTSLILNQFPNNLNTKILSGWLDNSAQSQSNQTSYSTVKKFSSSTTSPKFSFSFIENIPLPLSIQTQPGKILYCNQIWRKQINCPKEFFADDNSLTLTDRSAQKTNFQAKIKSKIQPYCLKSNSAFTQNSFSFLPERNIQLLDSIAEVNHQLNLAQVVDNFDEHPKNKQLWQYHRIPIAFDDLKNCYLVIALQSLAKNNHQLKQPQHEIELEQLNLFKDRFLGYISHELKSPLTAIVGLSSLLKEQQLGQLNQRQSRYADLIYRSGRKLTNIVNDLLDLTNLTTAKIPSKIELVNLKNICEEAYQQLINKTEAIAISKNSSINYPKLKFNLESEVIAADKNRLIQILSRLLKISLKSNQTPPEIIIELKKWHNYIAINIKNPQLFLSNNFQELAGKFDLKSQQNLANQSENLELDLILAQQIAKSDGGDIYCLFDAEQGSEFTLLIPNHKLDNQIDSSNSVSAHLNLQSNSNLIILIGETNPKYINKLAEQLINIGYQPVIAKTGIEILEKARQLQPSKILLNADLPLLGTEDLLTLLKADDRTKRISVFLLRDKQNQLVLNNNKLLEGYLDLPLEKSALLEVIKPIKSELIKKRRLTILSLHPNFEFSEQIINSQLDCSLKAELDYLDYRVIEADCLEQGELLARIWQIDAIVLDGDVLDRPIDFLTSLKASKVLAALPLVILDAKTTAAANQIEGLSVFPCLVPAEKRNICDLAEVIQIATKIN